jgi:hypothetical protein
MLERMGRDVSAAKLRFGTADGLVSPPYDCWDKASKELDDALASVPAK